MEVTAIGWALLILGPALMIARPRWLYAVTIFSLPFTGTEFANVGSGLDASGVQISMFLGSLLLFRYAISRFWKARLWLPRKGRAQIVLLGLFVAVTGLSLVMPLWINGRVQVPSAHLGDFTSTPILFRSGNFTGFLYMVYGFGFAYFVAEMIQRVGVVGLSVKSYIAGSIFASSWGMVEFACKTLGIAYPAMIFNNGKSISTMGYAVLYITAGVPRLSSVSVEPSNLAQTLLVAVSLYLPFVFGKHELFGKVLDRLFISLIFLVLLLTSSSTAYLGFIVLLLLVFAMQGVRNVLSARNISLMLVGLTAAGLLYATVPIVRAALDAVLFSKAESGSALERLMTITNAYDMFVKYPVLGTGWASVTSHDLIFFLLANAGILGLSTFAVAMYSMLRALHRSVKGRESLGPSALMQMDLAAFVALGVTLATSITSGFPGVFSFFWFVIGVAISGSSVIEFEKQDSQFRSREPECEVEATNPAISPRPC